MISNAWVEREDKTYGYAGSGGAIAGFAVKNPDGSLALHDEKGNVLRGWQTLNGAKFYAKDDGTLWKGWLKGDNSWYYFDSEGRMSTGWAKVDGIWYYLEKDGKMKTGWLNDGTNWYYLYPVSGAMATGWCNVDGVTYWMHPSGVMATGWQVIDGRPCYFEQSGAYNPNADPMTYKAQFYTSATNWLFLVDTSRNIVGVYTRENGSWALFSRFLCACGKPSAPTVLGEFTVASRGHVFGSGYSCYFWTQFYGDFLFHSVLYDQGTWRVQDGRLGMHISHGCVRLDANDAKWIYDNIPRGTKVVTYQ